MNDLPFARYLLAAAFLICWVGGVVTWFFSAYYMFKTMTRFHPDRKWGRYIPFSIFSAAFFTDEGNVFRAKLLKSAGLFFLFGGLGMAIGFVGKTLTEG